MATLQATAVRLVTAHQAMEALDTAQDSHLTVHHAMAQAHLTAQAQAIAATTTVTETATAATAGTVPVTA